MRKRIPKDSNELDALDEMIAEITVDAYGDDEQPRAFRQAFEDALHPSKIFKTNWSQGHFALELFT